jgi:hypothetical protein
MRDILPGLRNAFSASPDALNALQPFDKNIYDGFDGIVDGPASLALLVGSASARPSANSEVNNYLNKLPMPNDIGRTTTLAVTGLLTSTSSKNLGSLLRDPAFANIAHIATDGDPNRLIEHLPTNARTMVQAFLASDFDASSSLHDILMDFIH